MSMREMKKAMAYPNPYWDCWMVRPTLDSDINSRVDVLLTLLYRAEGMAIGCNDPDLAKQLNDGRWVLRSLIEDVAGMDFDGQPRKIPDIPFPPPEEAGPDA